MQSLRSFSSKETVTLPSVSEEVTWTHACVHNARLLRILCYAPRRTQLLAWSVQSVLTNQDSCFHLVDYGQLLPQYHPLLKQCWVGEVWANASAERNMNLGAHSKAKSKCFRLIQSFILLTPLLLWIGRAVVTSTCVHTFIFQLGSNLTLQWEIKPLTFPLKIDSQFKSFKSILEEHKFRSHTLIWKPLSSLDLLMKLYSCTPHPTPPTYSCLYFAGKLRFEAGLHKYWRSPVFSNTGRFSPI